MSCHVDTYVACPRFSFQERNLSARGRLSSPRRKLLGELASSRGRDIKHSQSPMPLQIPSLRLSGASHTTAFKTKNQNAEKTKDGSWNKEIRIKRNAKKKTRETSSQPASSFLPNAPNQMSLYMYASNNTRSTPMPTVKHTHRFTTELGGECKKKRRYAVYAGDLLAAVPFLRPWASSLTVRPPSPEDKNAKGSLDPSAL